MVKLENMFLKNILLYLPTIKDIGHFAQVSKKCEEAILTIYINPFDLTLNHSFDEIIPLFPKLQTFYVRRCKERLYKINANEIPLIEIGNWQEGSKESQVFGTKWFASKIRKMRINGYISENIMSKHSEYYSQLQEVVFQKFYSKKAMISMFNLPTLRKVTIICPMTQFKSLTTKFDFTARKETKYIIIFSEIGFDVKQNMDDLKDIIRKLSENCEFYTRIICKSTINLQFLPTLPYENKYSWDPNDSISLHSDVFDQLYVINDLLKKCEIDRLSIGGIANDFADDFVDLSPLQLKRLSLTSAMKNGLKLTLFSQLESLFLSDVKSNIDISSCHLKEFTENGCDSDPIYINDDNLEEFSSYSRTQFKWNHNGVELGENEMELDLNKISIFQAIINTNLWNNAGFVTSRQITIHKDGKTAILKGCNSFFYDGSISFSVGEEQEELDLSAMEFSKVDISKVPTLGSLKVKTQNFNLLESNIGSIVIEGECDIDLRDSKIESITADVINNLNFKGCYIGSITANKIKKIDGPKTRIKKLNVSKSKKGKK